MASVNIAYYLSIRSALSMYENLRYKIVVIHVVLKW